MLADSSAFTTTALSSSSSPVVKLLLLWRHECLRVFCDKLITLDDKVWVESTIQEVIEQKFGGTVGAAAGSESYFVDFLRDAPVDETTGEVKGPRPSCYEAAVGGLEKLRYEILCLFSAVFSSLAVGMRELMVILNRFKNVAEQGFRSSLYKPKTKPKAKRSTSFSSKTP